MTQTIAVTNDIEYGLTAQIWTDDHSRVPFGGFKHSGLGKEGNLTELMGSTREKAIAIHTGGGR
jgi:acyl-CoA reductase-like NAD-dependent aldehyde dehydrogenase